MAEHRTSPNASIGRLFLVLGIVAGLCLLIDALRPMLSPFIVGALAAYLFDPLADKLERNGLSRTLATVVITVGVFGAIIVLLIWLGPLLGAQAADLAKALPAMIDSGKDWLRNHADEYLAILQTSLPGEMTQPASVDAISNSISERAYGAASQVISKLATSGMAILNVAAMLLITPVVCFYLIRDYDNIVAQIDHLLPLKYKNTIHEQVRAIDATLAAYLRGQLEVMVVLAIYYAVALAVLGVPYALILALVSGVMILIPYLGTMVSMALALGVAYSHGGDVHLVFWTLGVYGVGQVLEGQVLVPKLIGEHVGLHPLWVLFGLLAGGVLFGFIGVLLAVPITAVIGVLIKFAVARYKMSTLYQAS